MSDPERVPVPWVGVAAVLAGAGSCLIALGVFLAAYSVDVGGSWGPEILLAVYPIVVIAAIVLSLQAGVAKTHRYGVIGGVLTLLPLVVLVVGVAVNL